MKKTFPIYTMLIILGVLLLGVYIWLSTKPTMLEKGRQNRSFLVKVSHPMMKSVPLALQEVGTAQPEESVSIIPQVTGTLTQIHIHQGQDVEKGQLLFELDPAMYLAAVEQAKANLERDQAQLTVLKASTERYKSLAQLEYVTRQQYEEAEAASRAQKAIVASAEAQLKQAQIQLSYTKIYSPMAGKAGSTAGNVGNLITANSAPLVVINRMHPMMIHFSIGQDQLAKVLEYQKAGTLNVEIMHENSSQILAKGELVSINNSVNNQTGTVDMTAKTTTPNISLWPGQLVTVKLILTVQQNALTIPASAIQVGQQGHYVYRVKQGRAVIQPITVAREVNHEAIIGQGLNTQDTVITEIPPGIGPGMLVQVTR